MRTRGGKSRIRREVGELIIKLADLVGVSRIEDRCCGSLAVTRGIFELGQETHLALDANEALLCTYRAVRDGWIPPRRIDKAEYKAVQSGSQDINDPLTAFVLLFCSYGGCWGTGMMPDDKRWPEDGAGRHASVKAHNELLELVEVLQRIELVCGDAWDALPVEPSMLYFDPPYAGSEDYAFAKAQGQRPFDRERFLRELWSARKRHAIVVSEFAMPDGWREIRSIAVRSPGLMANKVERFFTPKDGLVDTMMRETAVDFRVTACATKTSESGIPFQANRAGGRDFGIGRA